MNCEQVEERLSAYLDNMLAPAERRDVTVHLQACSRCMALLAELRQNDILLAQLPRVAPTSVLRERLFALSEIRELSEAGGYTDHAAVWFGPTQSFSPSSYQTLDLREPYSQPQLPSFVGGRGLQVPQPPGEREIAPTPPTVLLHPPACLSSSLQQTQQYSLPRVQKRPFTPLKVSLAAALLLTLGTVGLLSLSLQRRASSANLSGAITPPSGPGTGQAIPLAAGSRFVFLRDGALWSTLTLGGKHQPERLTPVNVTVAPGWVVNPPQDKQDAGDVLAYIDLRGARLHVIRSDGQQDTPVGLTLLRTNVDMNWQSPAGQMILKSLAWSPDSSMLAFVADPTGSGLPGLYLATPDTGSVSEIASNLRGNFAHLIWSPDSTRLVFTLTRAGIESVQTYHVGDHSVLDLSNLPAAQGNSLDNVLALDWFSSAGQTAVTWSLGSIGHVRSVWIHRVGVSGTLYPQQLLSGEYLQALYSPGRNNQTGGWLLVASAAGQAGDIWRLNLEADNQFVPLSQGKQVSFARWSPDGSMIFYLDSVTNGQGNGHLVNLLAGTDQLVSAQIALSPMPDWSADGLQLVYSTGTQIGIAHTPNAGQCTYLHLHGQISNFSWSPSALNQLVISSGSPDPGLYLVDTQKNTSLQLDSVGTDSAIQWTEIP